MAVPVGVAYRLTDRVSVGAEVQPMFGQLRTHFTGPGFEFRYKINGPGVQGMAGATLRPNEQWAFGLGVRTPGMIWMTGSMPVPNAGRQGVHSDLEMPAQVFLGATWRGLPRLALPGGIRFTNSSTLGHSKIEYDLTPLANSGFYPPRLARLRLLDLHRAKERARSSTVAGKITRRGTCTRHGFWIRAESPIRSE